MTIEEGYINQFGKTLYELFFKRYIEKLWGTSCKNISADWLGQRSRGFNVTTIIKNTIFPKDKIVSFVDEFSYPDLGIGRIAQKLADSLIRGGGNIILNANISYIENSNYSIDTIIYKQKIATKSLKADAVVSTIPLSKLISCLKPAVPKEILKVNRKLTYRDEVQVVLFVNKTKVTPDTWVYVHPFEIPFVRFMEMDNWSTKLSPHGTTAIVFELVCNKDDSVWRKSDRELIEWITGIFIDEFGFIYKKDIKSSYVHRVEGEYPVYHIGYQNDLVVLKSYLNKFTNLQIAGRNGTFRYNNMDHSIEMGLYAAWNIIDGENKFDINSVNIEREYLEEKKIKDGAEFIEDQKVE